ncbi:MAG: hypothetical protein Q9183_004419 [Haloplaca sp. 2 TL-2023]
MTANHDFDSTTVDVSYSEGQLSSDAQKAKEDVLPAAREVEPPHAPPVFGADTRVWEWRLGFQTQEGTVPATNNPHVHPVVQPFADVPLLIGALDFAFAGLIASFHDELESRHSAERRPCQAPIGGQASLGVGDAGVGMAFVVSCPKVIEIAQFV